MVVSWWVFAVCCMLGGTTAGYIQPRGAGPPWQMIGLGTLVGAAVGAILAGITRAIARRARVEPTPPPPAS
jgi:hypothetical protein